MSNCGDSIEDLQSLLNLKIQSILKIENEKLYFKELFESTLEPNPYPTEFSDNYYTKTTD